MQLYQIRKALEEGCDISCIVDPEMKWSQIDRMRQEKLLQSYGIAIELTEFDSTQLYEIQEGLGHKIDVSCYANTDFIAPQMKEIRLGLEHGINVEIYLDPEYDWFQMEEFRKGLEGKIDISLYAQKD